MFRGGVFFRTRCSYNGINVILSYNIIVMMKTSTGQSSADTSVSWTCPQGFRASSPWMALDTNLSSFADMDYNGFHQSREICKLRV